MTNELNEAEPTHLPVSKGRPRKNPEAVKTAYLGFRVPEEEYKAIEAAAAAVGETVSEYARNAVELRMEIPKLVEPSASVSYTVSNVNVSDRNSSEFQSNTQGVTTQAPQQKIMLAD